MPTVKKQASLQGALAALEANQERFFQFCCEGFFGKSGCFWWRKKTNPFKIHQNLVQESLVLETDAGEVAWRKISSSNSGHFLFRLLTTCADCELSKDHWI